VTAGGGHPGYIIDGITGVAEPGKAGPLYDPLAVDGNGNEADNVKISGPRLAFAYAGAAGYVVDLETPEGLRKSYQVVLAKGKPYVTVECRMESSTAAGNRESNMEITRLELGQGAELEVSGNKVAPGTSDDPIELMSQVGKPYAVVDSGGCTSILTCPINSDTYPDGWALSKAYIAPTTRSPFNGSQMDASFTFILGTGDRKVIDSLKTESLSGMEGTPGEEDRQVASEGFAIESSPSVDALRKGEQTLSLSIYRRYKKVLDR
jgi:hypothetical protein